MTTLIIKASVGAPTTPDRRNLKQRFHSENASIVFCPRNIKAGGILRNGTITDILDSCLSKSLVRDYNDYRNVIVFEKLRF